MCYLFVACLLDREIIGVELLITVWTVACFILGVLSFFEKFQKTPLLFGTVFHPQIYTSMEVWVVLLFNVTIYDAYRYLIVCRNKKKI